MHIDDTVDQIKRCTLDTVVAFVQQSVQTHVI
jgi:hypothetical protein